MKLNYDQRDGAWFVSIDWGNDALHIEVNSKEGAVELVAILWGKLMALRSQKEAQDAQTEDQRD